MRCIVPLSFAHSVMQQLSGGSSSALEGSYGALCAALPPELLRPCLRQLMEVVTDVLVSFNAMRTWHQTAVEQQRAQQAEAAAAQAEAAAQAAATVQAAAAAAAPTAASLAPAAPGAPAQAPGAQAAAAQGAPAAQGAAGEAEAAQGVDNTQGADGSGAAASSNASDFLEAVSRVLDSAAAQVCISFCHLPFPFYRVACCSAVQAVHGAATHVHPGVQA